MAFRRSNLRRRPTRTPEEIEAFRQKSSGFLQQYPANRVINMDDTNWKMVANGYGAWSKKGTESLNCYIGNDVKEGWPLSPQSMREGENYD
jgi:hypothetical protein